MAQVDSAILDLIGQLHEGVVDEDLWDRGIGSMCALLQVPMLVMGTVGQGGKSVQLEFGRYAAREAIALLEGPLADPRHNPWLALAARHPLRRPVTVEDVGGQEALKSTRIWNEFYRPFDIGDSLGAALERQPEYANILMFGRRSSQPMFRAADRSAFAALMPHIARAWRVKRALREWETLAGTLKFVLDRLDRAVIVTGPEGKVRFANRAADRLLTRGDGIDARRGSVRATKSGHSAALLSLIEKAAWTGTGDESVAVDALSLPSADAGPSLAIVAEPLAPAHSDRLGHKAERGAVLFISDSEACNRPPVERLRVVYDLTPAEARLTSLVVEGKDVASAAGMLGVSPNTVKYHLKAIYEKVGVSRQSQLVRRVLADVGGLAEPEKMVPSKPA
ncbi:MAG TPA: helix-turn-helix transcriptional regulator [Allosphingosinicella sp.]|nr:helix-turn-helix transcriptional regulator [Allosphingosinicella sp.]